MSDRYEKIRKALAMGPTPGPFSASRSYSPGNQELILRLTYKDEHGITENYCTVRNRLGDTWKTEADAAYIAACDPDTIRALLDERDALEAENERLQAEIEALRADEEGHAITAVEVTLFGRACYLPADIAQEVEQRLEAAERVAEASRQLVSMYER